MALWYKLLLFMLCHILIAVHWTPYIILLSHATCLSLANYSICDIVSLYLPDSRNYFTY